MTGEWAEVARVDPGKKRIALTFDAGAAGENLPRILDALKVRDIRITFFITGKFAEKYPGGIRRIVSDGHELANHTYSHPDMRTLDDEKIKYEFARTEEIVREIAGVSTRPYWRPPYGSRDNRVLNIAASQGYRSIFWTLDSLDSVGAPKTADLIFERVTNSPGIELDGAIILQHIGSDASTEALPKILDRLHDMGLQVVPISKLLSP